MRRQTKLWTTKDKRRIRICDMDDSHLVNCVKMLKRKAEFEKWANDLQMVTGPRPNGDGAQDSFDQACNEVWDKDWDDYAPPILQNMLQDIVRRAIKRPGILTQMIGIPNWMLGR